MRKNVFCCLLIWLTGAIFTQSSYAGASANIGDSSSGGDAGYAGSASRSGGGDAAPCIDCN
ncbi:putative membrane protein [Robbsia andropogonis]